jgi:GAF domain-containing protein
VRDEVEGVIEVLDKSTAATFGLNDLDLLGLFARPAAIALEQARTVGAIGTMIVREMERLADERGEGRMAQAARTVLSEGSSLSEDTIALARLIHTLNRRGERSRQLAREILESVVTHTG